MSITLSLFSIIVFSLKLFYKTLILVLWSHGCPSLSVDASLRYQTLVSWWRAPLIRIELPDRSIPFVLTTWTLFAFDFLALLFPDPGIFSAYRNVFTAE
jgi:hypothetical protein